MGRRSKNKVPTARELLFIEHFAGNQTEAAAKAGYKNPSVECVRLMKRPHVREAINKKLDLQTKEAAKRSIRKIKFGRNDIIAKLGELAGLDDPKMQAESESARATCLRTLADIYDLLPSAGSAKNAGMFKGWTEEELEDFRQTGRLPARFVIEDYSANNPGNTTGFSTSAAPPAVGPTVGQGRSHPGTPAAPPRARS